MTLLFKLIILSIWYNYIKLVSSHGRLIEPPSRSSAWRFGFQTPPNYNDHELYCGGFSRQWNKNEGKCGECGDAWDIPKPRPNEYGGTYGLGVNVRNYKPGTKIEIKIDLTASHFGYFEFRVCPFIDATQKCLDKYQLYLTTDIDSSQKLRFYPERGGAIYTMYGILPKDLTCNQCVLQWRYIAGNNWGTCKNGTGMVGCGPQEEFRACADISIGNGHRVVQQSTEISQSSTDKPTIDETELNDEVNIEIDRFVFSGLFIVLFSFLLVLFMFALLYICYYEDRIKKLLERGR